MPDDTGKEQSKNTWPLTRFSFLVKIGNTEISFQEVTGLNAETQVVEYRGGSNPGISTIKMPGIQKYGNVTLKKGLFKDDKALWDMYNEVVMNTFQRRAVSIFLLDENNAVTMQWNLINAFLAKMTVTDMKPGANEAAVETMELAHEGLKLV